MTAPNEAPIDTVRSIGAGIENLISTGPERRASNAGHHRRLHSVSGRGVRHASLLFVAVGVVGLINDFVPGGVDHGNLTSMIQDASALTIGALAFLLRKNRFLLGRGGILLAVLALAMVAVDNASGEIVPITLGTYFMIIVVWVGMWYPPWTVLALSPVMAAAYLAPLFLGAPRSPGDLAAVSLVLPTTVLVGETIARYTERVRRAQASRERLLNELSREIITDELTGVGNRRLGELLLESLKPGDAVAILDLDHFKSVNDNYGHPEGDRVLHELGSCLNASMRDHDAAARMGGEEFMVVMRDAGPNAINIVSRLLQTWRQSVPLATMSAGVAVHSSRTGPQSTYAAADRALYEAKHSGRDRAVLAHIAEKAT